MSFIYSQLFVTPKYPTDSFTGQTIVVTGSNVGLGREAARHFVRLNAAKVILAVRNLSAGEEAKKSIEESTKRTGVVEVWQLDLSSYDSVKAFAKKAEKLPRLDVLLENAGIATGNFSLAEGHERTITVNVISTFLLGLLLVPKLKETRKAYPDSRATLTIVSSEVHAWTKFEERNADKIFATLSDEKTANMSERYQTSKLLEVLTVREIAPALANSGVTLNMLNPGLCHSELARDSGWALWVMKQILARTTEVGSRTLVAAAAAGQESHGEYMSDGKVADGALSPFVKSEDGKKAQRRVWGELSSILENVQPGVAKVL